MVYGHKSGTDEPVRGRVGDFVRIGNGIGERSQVPIFVPIPVQELTSETEWSREEKVSRVAQMLKYQQQRHCFIKLDTSETQPLKIPFVREFHLSDGILDDYQREIYHRQGALTAAEVDRLISESQQAFLTSFRLKESAAGQIEAREESGEDDFFDSLLPKID